MLEKGSLVCPLTGCLVKALLFSESLEHFSLFSNADITSPGHHILGNTMTRGTERSSDSTSMTHSYYQANFYDVLQRRDWAGAQWLQWVKSSRVGMWKPQGDWLPAPPVEKWAGNEPLRPLVQASGLKDLLVEAEGSYRESYSCRKEILVQ